MLPNCVSVVGIVWDTLSLLRATSKTVSASQVECPSLSIFNAVKLCINWIFLCFLTFFLQIWGILAIISSNTFLPCLHPLQGLWLHVWGCVKLSPRLGGALPLVFLPHSVLLWTVPVAVLSPLSLPLCSLPTLWFILDLQYSKLFENKLGK